MKTWGEDLRQNAKGKGGGKAHSREGREEKPAVAEDVGEKPEVAEDVGEKPEVAEQREVEPLVAEHEDSVAEGADPRQGECRGLLGAGKGPLGVDEDARGTDVLHVGEKARCLAGV